MLIAAYREYKSNPKNTKNWELQTILNCHTESEKSKSY